MLNPSFPELTNRQIEVLKRYGTLEFHENPTVVIDYGESKYDFFVILKGAIKIFNSNPKKDELAFMGVHQFSGSSSILSSRVVDVQAETIANTQLLRIKQDQLKSAIARYSDISDVLLNAFLLRENIVRDSVGGLKIIGSEHSNETYAIRDFMDKNNILYNFIDSDKKEGLIELLLVFNLKETDLPVLINNSA